VTQEEIVQIIRDLQNYATPDQPQQLLFQFENNFEAASHNAMILHQFNFNLQDAITAQQNTQIMFGSEFKHPRFLEELLSDHPNWVKLSFYFYTALNSL